MIACANVLGNSAFVDAVIFNFIEYGMVKTDNTLNGLMATVEELQSQPERT